MQAAISSTNPQLTHLTSKHCPSPAAAFALDQNAAEQVGIDLGSDDEFDERDHECERVGLVRCFGLDVPDQILNRLEALLHDS